MLLFGLCSVRTMQGMRGCAAIWTMFCPDYARDERLCCYLQTALLGSGCLKSCLSRHPPFPLPSTTEEGLRCGTPQRHSASTSYLPGVSCRSLPGPSCLPYATPIFSMCCCMQMGKGRWFLGCTVECSTSTLPAISVTYDVPRPLHLHTWCCKLPADQQEGKR